MDKLEHYLDQVCRGIAGPRAMRLHVRQELREHLQDAIAEHRAAGMSPDEATSRALEDFGGPEQVRSELEAAHGHRLLSVIIDKAMQWKEQTMKAKWLWTTWAHAGLFLLIVIEFAFILAAMIFLMPKAMEIVNQADPGRMDIDAMMPMSHSFLGWLYLLKHHALLVIVVAAVLWIFFEWRNRSENKPMIRLSIMSAGALLLMLGVVMTTLVMVVPLAVAADKINARLPEQAAAAQMAELDRLTANLDEAMARKDWPAVLDLSHTASGVAREMAAAGATAPALLTFNDQTRIDALRGQLNLAHDHLIDAWVASKNPGDVRVAPAIQEFHRIYDQIKAATKPAQ